MATHDDHSGAVEPTIRRGRVDSLTLYEITDHELETLERGSPGSTELNFAVALLSVFFSCVTTLLSASPEGAARTFFYVTVSVSLVLGLYFLIKWRQTHNDVKNVVAKIKARVAELPATQLERGQAMELPEKPNDSGPDQAG